MKKELNEKIENLIADQGSASDRLEGFAEKVESLISDTIDRSAKEQVDRSWDEKEKQVLAAITEHGELTGDGIRRATGINEGEIPHIVFTLGREKKLEWEGGPTMFSSVTKFRLGKYA